jgi:predicted nucleic acid-binding protein
VGALILDASVLIGLLDTADAHHEQAVDEVEAADSAGETLLLPASAYSEALVSFAREGRTADAREAVAAMGIEVVAMTQLIAERAAELRAKHEHLRVPDAIVLATAHGLGAQLLTYDEDLDKVAKRG